MNLCIGILFKNSLNILLLILQLCTACNKTFKYKHTLKRHMYDTHKIVNDERKNSKNVKCDFCTKNFGQRKDMLRHKRTIHKHKEQNSTDMAKCLKEKVPTDN